VTYKTDIRLYADPGVHLNVISRLKELKVNAESIDYSMSQVNDYEMLSQVPCTVDDESRGS
jgi:hypothetical protein